MRFGFLLPAALYCAITAAGATTIVDPVKFVSDVYHNYVTKKDYLPPDDIYSPRLKALMDEDRRRANGEVGCIDFDFWVDGQDFKLSKVKVVGQDDPAHPDRTIVVATFDSLGEHENLSFEFVRVQGKWKLDEVTSLKKPGWVLSKLIKCWK